MNVQNCIVNVGTIGHADQGKTTLTAAITTVLAKPARSLLAHSTRSITRRKKKLVVSPSTPLTLNMTPRLPLRVRRLLRATPTMLKHDH
ncbi:GTP-binding protein [Klebsiella pneumoniae]|nr:GTP-binding protein [Klebsiella pneumoniae]